MNLKLHLIDFHINSSTENVGDYTEEQGESSYQYIKVMEKRYRAKWSVYIIADYCWILKIICNKEKIKKRNLLHRFLEVKRDRYKRNK